MSAHDLRGRLIAELESARSAAEVCAALARVEWYKPTSKECPDDKLIPTPADLAEWLPQCPASFRAEAADLMDDVAQNVAQRQPPPFKLLRQALANYAEERDRPVADRRADEAAARQYLSAFGVDGARLHDLLDKDAILNPPDRPDPNPDTLERILDPSSAPSALYRAMVPVAALGALMVTLGSPGGSALTMAGIWRRWISAPEHEGDGKTLLGVERLHALWMEARKLGTAMHHPLGPIVAAWQAQVTHPPSRSHAIVLSHYGTDYTRTPGLMSAALLSPVEAVSVDGRPFGSRAPIRIFKRLPASVEEQNPLDPTLGYPGPRTLDEAAVDPVLRVLSGVPFNADSRSPLRSDVLTLVRLGCAIQGGVTLQLDDLARVLRGRAGRVQASARRRAQDAASAGSLIVWYDSKAFQMVRAYTEGGYVIILPADWWQDGKGGANAWRLSGALYRLQWAGAKQGGHRRMAEGIEAALSWTSPTGNSPIPAALQPESLGGPGPEYTIDWRHVMYLSGEPYPKANDATARRTYRNRVAAFIEAGYRVPRWRGRPNREAAPAGDTWEIVDQLPGRLIVRASARYCEAVKLSQRPANFKPVTLERLLQPPDSSV